MRWHYGAAADCNASGCRGVLFRANAHGQFEAAGELEVVVEGHRVRVRVPLERIGNPSQLGWAGIAVLAGGGEGLPTDRVPDSGFETFAAP